MTTDTMKTLDLDAELREIAMPDGIRIPYRGEVFILPAELPLDVITPLLDEDLDLAGIVKQVLAARGDGIDTIFDVLLSRPDLPKSALKAFHGVWEALFGAEDYQRFLAKKPGHKTYATLFRLLVKEYAVNLGEASASLVSSESDAPTSKPTSSGTTDSTPAASDVSPESAPATSASGD